MDFNISALPSWTREDALFSGLHLLFCLFGLVLKGGQQDTENDFSEMIRK